MSQQAIVSRSPNLGVRVLNIFLLSYCIPVGTCNFCEGNCCFNMNCMDCDGFQTGSIWWCSECDNLKEE